MPRKIARTKAAEPKRDAPAAAPKHAAAPKPRRHVAKPAVAHVAAPAPVAAPPEPGDPRLRLAEAARDALNGPPRGYPTDGAAAAAIAWVYKNAGLPAPAMEAGRRIGEAALAVGDLVVFKSGKVCMVVERGADPLLFTHRPGTGPSASRLSAELEPPHPTAFLTFV